MALADRLQQEQSTTETLDALTSTLPAVEQHLTSLTTAVRELREATSISAVENSRRLEVLEQQLRESTMQHSGRTPEDSQQIESRLSEIEQTLGVLGSALDGSLISKSATAIQRSTTALERTTARLSESMDTHSKHVENALNTSGRAVLRTRDEAVKAIRDVSSEAADEVGARLERATERADEVVAVAERLQKRLGPALVGRLALALLPLATVLLMGVSTVWAVVHGYQWVMGMGEALWLRILTGVGLTGLVIGIGAGTWKLVVWVRGVLEDMR